MEDPTQMDDLGVSLFLEASKWVKQKTIKQTWKCNLDTRSLLIFNEGDFIDINTGLGQQSGAEINAGLGIDPQGLGQPLSARLHNPLGKRMANAISIANSCGGTPMNQPQ